MVSKMDRVALGVILILVLLPGLCRARSERKWSFAYYIYAKSQEQLVFMLVLI